MLNFHWSLRTEHRDGVLLDTVKSLESKGYTSALCQFQVHSGDPFIVAAHAASHTSTLKYMVALRPYALTPAYCKMQCNSFYRSFGDRLILNMVSGTFDDENEIFLEKTTEIEYRRSLIPTFIEKFTSLSFDNDYRPKIAITGSSETSLDLAENWSTMNLMLLSDFVKNKETLANKSFKKCVKISTIIDNTFYEAEERFKTSYITDREKDNIMFGTIDSLINEFKLLEEQGVTDILLSNTMSNMYDTRVHDLVKELSNV